MIHIVKTKKGQFQAVTISSTNGKVLQTSELETRKENVWKNIFACAWEYILCTVEFLVQDDTEAGKPIVYVCDAHERSKRRDSSYRKEPRYIAGKNPKTRTK